MQWQYNCYDDHRVPVNLSRLHCYFYIVNTGAHQSNGQIQNTTASKL